MFKSFNHFIERFFPPTKEKKTDMPMELKTEEQFFSEEIRCAPTPFLPSTFYTSLDDESKDEKTRLKIVKEKIRKEKEKKILKFLETPPKPLPYLSKAMWQERCLEEFNSSVGPAIKDARFLKNDDLIRKINTKKIEFYFSFKETIQNSIYCPSFYFFPPSINIRETGIKFTIEMGLFDEAIRSLKSSLLRAEREDLPKDWILEDMQKVLDAKIKKSKAQQKRGIKNG